MILVSLQRRLGLGSRTESCEKWQGIGRIMMAIRYTWEEVTKHLDSTGK